MTVDRYNLPDPPGDYRVYQESWLFRCHTLFTERIGDKLTHRGKTLTVEEALPDDMWDYMPKANSCVLVVKPPTESVAGIFIPDGFQHPMCEGYVAIPGVGVAADPGCQYEHPLDLVGRRFLWRHGGGIIMQTDQDEQRRFPMNYTFLGFDQLFCEVIGQFQA